VAVVVPAEYVFEDDTCDNVVGARCPRRVLKTKEEVEATVALRKGSAKVKGEVPKKGRAQPAIRKRRGRPKKTERPATVGDGPQAEKQEVAETAVEAGALQEAGNQPPAGRRGRSRNSGPRGQRGQGRNC
jgi:hypothetical protein